MAVFPIPSLAILLVLFLSVTFALPVWLRHLQVSVKGRPARYQLFVFLCLEFFLGLSVFLSFFSSWFTFQLVLGWFIPWLGVDIQYEFWDLPLTPRGFLGLLMLTLLPYAVFTRVGLVAVRDCHQVCKQQRDVVANHYSLGTIWKGF